MLNGRDCWVGRNEKQANWRGTTLWASSSARPLSFSGEGVKHGISIVESWKQGYSHSCLQVYYLAILVILVIHWVTNISFFGITKALEPLVLFQTSSLPPSPSPRPPAPHTHTLALSIKYSLMGFFFQIPQCFVFIFWYQTFCQIV